VLELEPVPPTLLKDTAIEFSPVGAVPISKEDVFPVARLGCSISIGFEDAVPEVFIVSPVALSVVNDPVLAMDAPIADPLMGVLVSPPTIWPVLVEINAPDKDSVPNVAFPALVISLAPVNSTPP
jgi:hypothetical protein